MFGWPPENPDTWCPRILPFVYWGCSFSAFFVGHVLLSLLMTLHTTPMSNLSPKPDPRHKRMQLNNWLQAHGGTHRLAWNNYIAGGPGHRPNWCSDCFVDGSLLGQGHGPSKADAQEDAAGKTLANLLSSHETATHS